MSSSSSVISPSAPSNGTSAGADRSPDVARVVRTLGWLGVLRLGLVQTALGAIVVLTTSTINRVMVVELALPALLPGLLVGLHYAVQVTRPHMGHGSDRGGRRTPWIVGGMAVLAAGGALAAFATALTATLPAAGIPLAVLAFVLVGLGVGCSGTSLLVLLAKSVTPRFRGAAATTVWVMMIVGFIVTSIVAGAKLDPFSYERLVDVTASVSLIAFLVTCVAVYGVERRVTGGGAADVVAGHPVAPTDVETPSAVGTPDARARSVRSGGRACRIGRRRERRGERVSSRHRRGLVRARGTTLQRVRVRLDARLQRPGPDPRAVRRCRVRHDAGREHTARGRPQRRRARRHAARRVVHESRQPTGRSVRTRPSGRRLERGVRYAREPRGARLAAVLDRSPAARRRPSRSVRSPSAGCSPARVSRSRFARGCSRWVSPTARSRSPPSAR